MIQAAQELLRPVLDNTIIDNVNHPTWTIYPPLTIHLEMLITHIDSRVSAMNIAAMVAEIIAMLFILALLIDRRVATGWWLLAWWNPVAVIWFAGEGHNDSFMALFLAAGLWLANRGLKHRSLIALSLACLAKPFAGWVLLAQLQLTGWRRIWLPALMAALGYLPFLAAGTGVLSSLGRFGGEKHFHGALEPLFRFVFIDWVPSDALRPLVLGCLSAVSCSAHSPSCATTVDKSMLTTYNYTVVCLVYCCCVCRRYIPGTCCLWYFFYRCYRAVRALLSGRQWLRCTGYTVWQLSTMVAPGPRIKS